MTRLSDLLRGAADRAPMGETSVSVERARKRISVHRGVRGVANGLAGAGVAALVLVGVIQPGAATSEKAAASEAAPNPASGVRDSDPALDSATFAGYGWWSQCGTYPIDAYAYDATSGLTLGIDSEGWADLEGGASIDVPVTLDAAADTNVDTVGADAVVLYQGMIVAYVGSASGGGTLNLAAGDSIDSTLTVPLVNCWDGTALPAGTYEVVASQAFTAVANEPAPAPTITVAPAPEPTVFPVPAPEPTAIPEPAPAPDVAPTPGGEGDGTAAATGDAGVSSFVGPIEPLIAESRVISQAVTLTIAGDPVENPFGPYIDVWTPPELPGDVLTPAIAREMYDAAVTVGTWGMAPGTSRWILPTYGDVATTYNARMMPVQSGWYGCSGDGSSGMTFPTASADLGLLDVAATVPSRIHLSYGWVVDDNPVVDVTVTNTSGYSLPGFYGEPSHNLYLVKEGRVVAEAYPVTTNPSNPIMYATMDAVPSPEVQKADELAQYWGILGPDATMSGTYLWRDLNGCWSGDRQATISAGTYTVLTMQSVYLQGEMIPTDGTIQPPQMGGATGETDPSQPSVGTIVAPGYYPTYDTLELQLWTSLGSVTITTG